jgi:hypothetical protein
MEPNFPKSIILHRNDKDEAGGMNVNFDRFRVKSARSLKSTITKISIRVNVYFLWNSITLA